MIMHTEIMTFLDNVRNSLSPASCKAYQSDLLQFSTWLIEEKYVMETITPLHISRYFEYLLQLGTLRSSVVRKATVLRRFFEFSNKQSLMPACIVSERTSLTHSDPLKKIILMLTEWYGCTIPNLQSLRVEHLDLQNGIIRFQAKTIELLPEHHNELMIWLSDSYKNKTKDLLFPYTAPALRALIKSVTQKPSKKNNSLSNSEQLQLFAGTIPLTDYQKKHPRS